MTTSSSGPPVWVAVLTAAADEAGQAVARERRLQDELTVRAELSRPHDLTGRVAAEDGAKAIET